MARVTENRIQRVGSKLTTHEKKITFIPVSGLVYCDRIWAGANVF